MTRETCSSPCSASSRGRWHAEHYLFAREMLENQGALTQVASVLGYSGLKALAESLPQDVYAILNALYQRQTGRTLPRTTDRKGAQLYWGLKPAFESRRRTK